jgi:putative addiction module component (TIGR02574 family)
MGYFSGSMTTKQIIQEVQALPIEERLAIVDNLLQSLNPPDAAIERKWLDVAKKRRDEMRSGTVNGVPGEEVFARIRQRFA